MSFIPEEEIKGKIGANLAPMIDFLFLMLVFFASLAVSRVTTKDTEIELVKILPEPAATLTTGENETQLIYIAINDKNEYKWVTEIRDYEMDSAEAIADELARQYERGLLSENKSKTVVMLKIDKQAQWEPILKVIFSIREIGFEIRPVYEPEKNNNANIANHPSTPLPKGRTL